MKRFTIILMLFSLTFSMGAQTDSLITEMLNAAVISDGNMTYKIDRTTHFFTKEQMWHRKFWYRLMVATMYFSAGMIRKSDVCIRF